MIVTPNKQNRQKLHRCGYFFKLSLFMIYDSNLFLLFEGYIESVLETFCYANIYLCYFSHV